MSRSLRLGIFIVTALSVLAVAVFLIGDKQLLFSRKLTLTTTFKSVRGLVEGAEVRIGGTHNGIVDRIELPADAAGEMQVVMKLDRSATHVLKTDSVATIETDGLLGGKYLSVSFGSPAAPEVTDGAHIASEPPVEIADMFKKVGDVLTSVQGSTDSIKQIGPTLSQGATAFTENMTALKHNFLLRGFFKDRGYENVADLKKHEVTKLPAGKPLKTFRYDASKIFADDDVAKLRSGKELKDAGTFLETTPFGLAVVIASHGMKGDTNDVEVLTQARAVVVRDYLVNNFKMNDTRVKTMGVGKTPDAEFETGTIEVRIYPASRSNAPAR